ncbi:MAG: flagellar assembly protein A [Wolinella sp.]
MEQVAKPLTFEPHFIADCESPGKELAHIANARGVDPNLLEIRIKEVFYFLKTKESPNFEEVMQGDVGFLDNKSFLLREDVEIRQRFALTIEAKKRRSFRFSLRLSEDFRELFFTLLKGSKIAYTAPFLEELFACVRGEKASLGVLFHHEEQEKERLAELLKKLHTQEELSEDCEILLTQGLGEGRRCVEASLILHFQKDPALSGKYPSVQKDTLLATFLKPQKGEAGRDCFGGYVPQKDPTGSLDNPLQMISGIEAIENDEKIDYKAQEAGYVVYENSRLSVVQKIEVSNVGIGTTGSLVSDLEMHTSVRVTENHSLKEALGDGARIEADTVEIAGNIGSASEVRAHTATIKGQTHQNSKVFADEIYIEVHKGYAEGDEVNIARLEVGIVRAKKVKIAHAYGGKIYAQEIYIDQLYSNLHAYASQKIEIAHLAGEDNKFTLTPLASPKQTARIEAILSDIKALKETLKNRAGSFFSKEIQEVRSLKSAASGIKQSINSYKISGKEVPAHMNEELKNYIRILKQIQMRRDEIAKLQNNQKSLLQELAVLQEPTLHAYIHARGGWKGYNEVRYKLLLPEKELFLAPKSAQHYGLLKLDEAQESIISQKGNS